LNTEANYLEDALFHMKPIRNRILMDFKLFQELERLRKVVSSRYLLH